MEILLVQNSKKKKEISTKRKNRKKKETNYIIPRNSIRSILENISESREEFQSILDQAPLNTAQNTTLSYTKSNPNQHRWLRERCHPTTPDLDQPPTLHDSLLPIRAESNGIWSTKEGSVRFTGFTLDDRSHVGRMSRAANRIDDSISHGGEVALPAERSSIDWPGRKPSRDWNRFTATILPPLRLLSRSFTLFHARLPLIFTPSSHACIRRCVELGGGEVFLEIHGERKNY